MAATSAAVRALALLDPDPPVLVHRLDAYVARHAEDQFVTLFCGLLDVPTGALRYVLAGHVPPLLLSGDSCRLVDVEVQPPLALAAARTAEHLRLGPDDVLVVVTDGVVESRRTPADDGLAAACAAVRAGAADPAAVAARVADAAVGTDDDVTVLALRCG
jgi:serine phosphatase RsbU (regulator of sigma subunit)